MCNCINEKEQWLRGLPNIDKDWLGAEIKEVSIDNKALMFNSSCGPQLYSTAKVKYDCLNKKGEKKHKKGEVNLSYHFCPFCGEKYE